jgi:hypothetical protein
MEAARTSETSVDNHFTRQYNPEDSSEHHTRRRENLKSHIDISCRKPQITSFLVTNYKAAVIVGVCLTGKDKQKGYMRDM